MKVEYSDTQPRGNARRKKRKKRRLKVTFFVFLIVLVIGVLIALSCTVLFNIKSFAVSGQSIYADTDILAQSGLSVGDNLFLMLTSKVEQNIETKLPYVKSAEVKRRFPDTVSIKITPATEFATIKVEEGYLVVDSDYKILAVKPEQPTNLTYIKGIVSEQSLPGTHITFADDEQKRILNEIIKLLADNSITATMIDVENKLELAFVIENRLYIELGNYSNLAKKMAHLVASLPEIEPDAEGTINLSYWSETNKKTPLKYENITDKLK